MQNMEKGHVLKWVLLNRPKILQMAQNLTAKIFCPSQILGILMNKGFIGRPQSVVHSNNKSDGTYGGSGDFSLLISGNTLILFHPRIEKLPPHIFVPT